MSDLLLNSSGDLFLPVNKSLRLTDGLAETAKQRLRIALQTFLGEWFLDTQIGVPYYRDVLIKNPNLDILKVLFRRKILDDPDVESVPRLDLSFEAPTRRLLVDFDAVLASNEVISLLLGGSEEESDDSGPDTLILLMV